MARGRGKVRGWGQTRGQGQSKGRGQGQAQSLLYMSLAGRFLYIVGACSCALPFNPRAF